MIFGKIKEPVTPRFRETYDIISWMPLTRDTLPERFGLGLLIEANGGKCECSRCGIKGTHIATYTETTDPRGQLVINIFAMLPDGSMRMMTKDHILPRLLGGTNFLSNLQIMCLLCNSRKSCRLTKEELEMVRNNPMDHLQLNPLEGVVTKKKWKNLFRIAPDLRPLLECIVSKYA